MKIHQKQDYSVQTEQIRSAALEWVTRLERTEENVEHADMFFNAFLSRFFNKQRPFDLDTINLKEFYFQQSFSEAITPAFFESEEIKLLEKQIDTLKARLKRFEAGIMDSEDIAQQLAKDLPDMLRDTGDPFKVFPDDTLMTDEEATRKISDME